MGEYRDGQWVPTFGDDQFGVVEPTQPINSSFKPITKPDYHRLLAMIYHGTGFEVSWHNREDDVIAIVKTWYEDSLK